MGSFNYFVFTIHMGSNCYIIINTGIRDFEVPLFKANSTGRNSISSENLLNRPIYAEIKTHILDRILHSILIFADSNDESKIAPKP